MTEEDLLRAAAAMGLAVDWARARDLAAEVERIQNAAQRLRELPLDLEVSPLRADTDGRG